MSTNRLSRQLDNYLQEFRDKARADNCPLEILSAVQRLSEMPKHMEIDMEGILRQATDACSGSSGLFRFIDRIIKHRAWDELKKQIIDTVARYGADTFITAKQHSIKPFLYDILGEIQEGIKRTTNESDSLRDKTFDIKRQLKELEDKHNALQEECYIQVSHMCRDYQLILRCIGPDPSGKTEQEIKRIAEDALEDVGVDILWEPPERDNGKHFLTQNDSKATVSGVVRPCLMKGSDVIQRGVIINRINEEK